MFFCRKLWYTIDFEEIFYRNLPFSFEDTCRTLHQLLIFQLSIFSRERDFGFKFK
eukprot:TRINITY_DN3990_c1_g1_i4.p1 TRINITY_DN3990_c1_g1~~TRINITY_DN3990_c1_g1_i4.p1  ORF type:complete len:55 (-),score=9.08 TRINITY_DN3990_c1_g1_i4:167-331(-)